MPFSRLAGGAIAGVVTVAALALGYFAYSKFGGGDTVLPINTVAAPLSTSGGTRRHKKRSKSNRKKLSS
jgi:hypothetical protein